MDGGNLADALSRIYNTGSPQVLVLASAAATVVNSAGVTPPSAESVAAAVRAYLSTELTRLMVLPDVTQIMHYDE